MQACLAVHSGLAVNNILHLPQLTYHADFKAGNCLQNRYKVSINFFVIVVVDDGVVTAGEIIRFIDGFCFLLISYKPT